MQPRNLSDSQLSRRVFLTRTAGVGATMAMSWGVFVPTPTAAYSAAVGENAKKAVFKKSREFRVTIKVDESVRAKLLPAPLLPIKGEDFVGIVTASFNQVQPATRTYTEAWVSIPAHFVRGGNKVRGVFLPKVWGSDVGIVKSSIAQLGANKHAGKPTLTLNGDTVKASTSSATGEILIEATGTLAAPSEPYDWRKRLSIFTKNGTGPNDGLVIQDVIQDRDIYRWADTKSVKLRLSKLDPVLSALIPMAKRVEDGLYEQYDHLLLPGQRE